MASLVAYVDKKTQQVNLEKFDRRVRQFAYNGIYPEVDCLLELSRSKKAKDIEVSASTGTNAAWLI